MKLHLHPTLFHSRKDRQTPLFSVPPQFGRGDEENGQWGGEKTHESFFLVTEKTKTRKTKNDGTKKEKLFSPRP